VAAENLDPPKGSKGDVVHAVVKAGLSALPIAGGPLVELFQQLVQPPLEGRRIEWMKAVGQKLEELDGRGIRIEDLGQNEEFVSAVMHASQIALRTHRAEKIDALKNAIFNVAAGQSPGEALEHMFLEWIDSLSVLHLQLLKHFQQPTVPPGLSMGGISNVIEYNFPELQGQRYIYDQVWKDLFTRGLVTTNNLHTTMGSTPISRTLQLSPIMGQEECHATAKEVQRRVQA
jgi:hypothetical protein